MTDIQGNYTPAFQPGGASLDRPDIGRPAPTSRTTSLGAVEARLQAAFRSTAASVDPELAAFLKNDVPYLMSVARAADRWTYATNAEDSRRWAGALQAAVRSNGRS